MRAFFVPTLLAAVVAFTSCSKSPVDKTKEPGALKSDFVVKARFTADITSNGPGTMSVMANPTNIPVSVIVSPNATLTVDSSGFAVPPISEAILDFGDIALTDVRDNSLRVCGTDGKTKCTKAVIRMYTTGVAGAGIWNAADGYGAPLLAKLTGGTVQTVGLGSANAVTVQSITIPNNKNNIRFSDFTQTPNYEIGADFTNAGAGSYSTTLVVEFGLSL